jgi:hypothetical protein
MVELLDRLKEPSTWAAFSGIVVSLGFPLTQYQAWTNGLAALCGLIGVVLREKK